MNEILWNVLSVLFAAVLLPLISLIGSKLISWLNNKMKNEKANHYLELAKNSVLNSVGVVFQTYVEALKKAGTFNALNQKEALQKAKELALSLMQEEVKQFIEKNYGDIDVWLQTQIEAAIYQLKK